MIGLAIIEALARMLGWDSIGVKYFYESLPIDNTGNLSNYGIYAVTNSAPMQPNGDFHQHIEFDIAIGEGVVDSNNHPVAEKYQTDVLADQIQVAVRDWLDDPTNSQIKVTETNQVFRDVRVLPSTSKARTVTLANGAIVKMLQAEVFYK